MKNFFKKIVLFLLQRFARRRLKKFKGKIVCVTGSIGKTSIKDAIYTVLNTKFRTLRNPGNMNTEFGLPLAILGLDSGYSSAAKWSWLVIKGFYKSLRPMYSEMIVVETGVDKPGDMDELMSIVKPDVAVMSLISPVHLNEGQFKDLDDIFEEKSKLVKALKDDGVAILNIDDERMATLVKGRNKKNTITYGESADADFKATGITEDLTGLTFNLNTEGRRIEAKVPILGKHHVNIVLPAIACGHVMGFTLEESLEALQRFKLPPGRLNLIEGSLDGVKIIDGSYNSSPTACIEALKTLGNLKVGKGCRKIAVLGSMNELGYDSDKLHLEVASNIPVGLDILITVGKAAEIFSSVAAEKGIKQVLNYATSQEAVDGFADKIQGNDIILVKGSQNNVRLERFVKAIMKNPEMAGELLVRQGRYWQKM